MSNFVVDCDNFQRFMEVVEWAIKSGLCFKADAENFVVRFTGGY